MKAILFQSSDQPLQVAAVPQPQPGKGELLIRIHSAALNHLDLWTWKEQTLPGPVIPGSDGSGVVCAAGGGADEAWIGKEVVVNPSLHWGENEHFFGTAYEILGNPTHGTFAEYIRIPAGYVYEKPAHLSLRQAAALPLAALTAYRALFTKAKVTDRDKVLITGIGGGAALFLLQMAVSTGADVYVTSSSTEKMEKALQLGAKGAFNYREADWVENAKAQTGGFDVIIDSAAGDGFAELTEAAATGARIVLFGRTAGNINGLRPGLIYNKQLQIMGTVMGTCREFASMLAYYTERRLEPVLDEEFLLEDIRDAVAYMQSGRHFGKITLKVAEAW
ncbi:MDR/zinc-dependent alcohol dehydrogenase-like family protein [Flaviaesturariibacter terrae]